ncbi:hypothetical protein GCM10010124_25850 [Pilimelia terevasa]|uniref:Uncharacterized protein n=1 Tax=Pilimelia terevasa TaxID=53372 RepID=A0A8J3BSW6_9ACTN|nr:hypothetical protein [Pilimelia terevasa]GGK31905.1 hypothetical protein GCM10010124_25850 [Pilimelia terevasa]
MPIDMPIDIDAIKQRDSAATPGPWQWFGNTDNHQVFLGTPDRGRLYIMRFVRWGMRDAQPVFYDHAGDTGQVKAADVPIYQVAPDATSRADERVYRADIRGLRQPDAEFIAAARQDVTDLLAALTDARAEVDRLRTGVKAVADGLDLAAAEDANPWLTAEHRGGLANTATQLLDLLAAGGAL